MWLFSTSLWLAFSESWNCWMDQSRGRNGGGWACKTKCAFYNWLPWYGTQCCKYSSEHLCIKSLGPIIIRGLCSVVPVLHIWALNVSFLFLFHITVVIYWQKFLVQNLHVAASASLINQIHESIHDPSFCFIASFFTWAKRVYMS